jgi:hypothetical protein
VKEDEVGRACSLLVGEVHTEFWLENLKERDHWEDIGVDGTLILKLFLENDWGVDWIHLA